MSFSFGTPVGTKRLVDTSMTNFMNGWTQGSFCFWAQNQNLSRDNDIITYGGAHAASGNTLLIWRDETGAASGGEPATSNTLSFFITFSGVSGGGNSVRCVAPAGSWNDTALHHWVCTFQAAQQYRIYKDGVLIRTSSNSLPNTSVINDTDFKLTIGLNPGPADSDYQTSGELEDIRIYDRRLSESEIETIYNARGSDGIINGLQLRLFANQEPPGTAISSTVKDIGPNKMTFTPTGSNFTYSHSLGLKPNKTKSFQG